MAIQRTAARVPPHVFLLAFGLALLAACNLVGPDALPPDVQRATVASSVRYVDPALGLVSIAPVSSGIEAVSYTGQTRIRRADGGRASASDIGACSTISASGVRDGRELRADEITLVQVEGAPIGAFTVDTRVTRTDLRAAPGVGAEIVATLPLRTRLSVHGRCREWIAVRTSSGQEGWLAASSTTLTATSLGQLPVLPDLAGRIPAAPTRETPATRPPGEPNDLQINGVVQSINAAERTFTVGVMGLSNLVAVTDNTRMADAQGQTITLADLRTGMAVQVVGVAGIDRIMAQQITIQAGRPPGSATQPAPTAQPGSPPTTPGGSVEVAVVVWGVDSRSETIYTDPLHMGDVVRLLPNTTLVFDNGQPANLQLLEVGMLMHVSGQREGKTIWADSIIVSL